MTEEIVPQIAFNFTGGANNKPPHSKATQPASDCDSDDQARVETKRVTLPGNRDRLRLNRKIIDRKFEYPGSQQLDSRGADKKHCTHSKLKAIPKKVRE